MGADYVNLREKKQKAAKEGKRKNPAQNRPELTAFVLALRGIPVTNPMLYTKRC